MVLGYYPELEEEIIEMVRVERAEGSAIGLSWVAEKAKELNESKYHYNCVFTLHWVKNVLERNDMTLRAPQNTRKETVTTSIPKVLMFHQSLRSLIQTQWRDLISLVNFLFYNII
jgi:hypothetical protein